MSDRDRDRSAAGPDEAAGPAPGEPEGTEPPEPTGPAEPPEPTEQAGPAGTSGALPTSGMGTGSDDEPPGRPGDGRPAALDRDDLAVAGGLAAPGPRRREPAAEESDEMRRAADDEATATAYRPPDGAGQGDDNRATFVEPET